MGDEYDFGNARLRARRRELLTGRDYDALCGRAPNALLGALAHTVYHPDVEHAASRLSGLPCLHDALRRNLARSLASLPRAYEDGARRRVELLTRRWDLRNLLLLLRGVANEVAPQTLLALAVPIGALDATSLEVLARAQSVRALVDMLVVARLPSPAVAHALLRAWPAASTDRLVILEHALVVAHAASLVAALGEAPRRDPLRAILFAELDHHMLLTALRLREARLRGERPPAWPVDGGPWLPGSRLTREKVEAVIGATGRGEVGAILSAVHSSTDWHGPIQRWLSGGELGALQAGLERALIESAGRLGRFGDPLSIAVPVGFTWAKETEVRNLRLVGAGGARGAPAAEIRDQLVEP